MTHRGNLRVEPFLAGGLSGKPSYRQKGPSWAAGGFEMTARLEQLTDGHGSKKLRARVTLRF